MRRIRPTCLALSLLLGAGPVFAQDAPARGPEALIEKSVKDLAKGKVGAAIKDDVTALRRGPLLIHGNYCGVGGRPGTDPVDALDAACMRHDDCTRTGTLPSCECNDHLRLAATEIAHDPTTPPEEKTVAIATASSMAVLICKNGPGAPPEVRAGPIEVAPVGAVPPSR